MRYTATCIRSSCVLTYAADVDALLLAACTTYKLLLGIRNTYGRDPSATCIKRLANAANVADVQDGAGRPRKIGKSWPSDGNENEQKQRQQRHEQQQQQQQEQPERTRTKHNDNNSNNENINEGHNKSNQQQPQQQTTLANSLQPCRYILSACYIIV